MVERFFARLSAPVRGLHQAAYVLAGLTLASQILALLRDRVFAAAFGAGPVLDIYYSAFRVPDLVFALIASLVSAYVLIPRISGLNQTETRALLSHSVSFLVIGGGLLCALLAVGVPYILPLIYPSVTDPSLQQEFVFLTRILLMQPIILGVSGIITSVTQVHRRFVLFALSPVLYNIGIIVGALVFYPAYGLVGIGIGVVIGALLHAAIHIPVLMASGVLPRIVVPSLKTLIPIFVDSLPRSLALGMGSFTALALTILAARTSTGAVSVITLAGNLEAVPLALIGASYAVAAFPALSESSAQDNREEFSRVLSASARHIILWSLVFVGIIIVLRAHLVRVILGAGAFDWNATRLTAALLAIFAVGLAAQGLVLLFSRALYAAKESWWPLIYQVVGGVVTVLLALWFLSLATHSPAVLAWFSGLFRVGDLPGTSILLIALASTLGQIILALWSLWALTRIAPTVARTLVRPFVQGGIAALVGGFTTYLMLYMLGGIVPLTTLWAVFSEGFFAGIVGLAASALALWTLGNDEFSDMIGAGERLFRARGILPPSAEEPQRQI